jgi:primary-amine oxidase
MTVTTTATHPLDPLAADELAAATAIFRRERGVEHPLFAVLTRHEPTHAELARWDGGAGPRPDRRAWAIVVVGPNTVAEVVIDLTRDRLDSYHEVVGERPFLLFGEIINGMVALREHPDWIAAMAARGFTGDDLDRIQMDPWPAGTFGHAHETDRRITKAIFYWRDEPDDNGYAHPIEGVMAYVDLGAGKVLEVVDTGTIPVPRARQSYYPEHNGPARTDLKPIEITQPDGPSFVVDGQQLRWQRWRLRVSMDQVEGLVLHDIGYDDPAQGGRTRSIIHRAAVSEMVVPYGHTAESQRWKNAFDAGEWGLGRMVNSLELGCDCLGEIHYFDAVLPDESGHGNVHPNVICVHEEDYSILWKHTDPHSFRTETRRQRRLVVSSIYTVGNYEYGFYWYFYLDGSIQLEVKLTGVIQPMAVPLDASPDDIGNANLVSPGVAGPHHQHLFCIRLDTCVDGPNNAVAEVDVMADPEGPENPEHNGFHTERTVLATELAARRTIDPARSRTWQVTNPSVTNAVGRPVAYQLVPAATPTMLAGPDASVHRRATFATRNLWVTRYDPDQLHAAGRYPNQSGGGGGLPAWTAGDRPIDDTDLVVWHCFGVTHIVRPEDWPVMPVESTGFWLRPYGFFDRNPALDVPPAPPSTGHADHCS